MELVEVIFLIGSIGAAIFTSWNMWVDGRALYRLMSVQRRSATRRP